MGSRKRSRRKHKKEPEYEETSGGLILVNDVILKNVNNMRREKSLKSIEDGIRKREPFLTDYILIESGFGLDENCLDDIVDFYSEDIQKDEDYLINESEDVISRDLSYFVYLALSNCFNIELPQVSKNLIDSIVDGNIDFNKENLLKENALLFESLRKYSKSSIFKKNTLENKNAFDISCWIYNIIKTQKIDSDLYNALSKR